MKFIKNNWQYIILIFLFAILAWFFPLTGKDWFWGCSDNFSNPLNLWLKSDGNIFFSAIVFTLTNAKIFRVVIYSIVTFGLFYLIKNTINKKNKTVLFISMFLFLILDLKIWKTVYANITNFSIFFIGTLLLILLINLINCKKFETMSPWLFFVLGVLGSLIHSLFTLIFFLVSVVLFTKKILKGKTHNSYLLLFLGSSIGVVSNLLGVYLNNIEIVDLYIITGAPSCCLDRIYEEKKAWLLKHFPALNIDNFICVPMGTNKADFIEHIDSSCYLIDDYNKNLEDWERAGGIGIKLVNDFNDKGSIGPKWQGKRLYYNSIEKFVL